MPLKVYDKDGNMVNYTETQNLKSISYYEYNGQRFYLDQILLKDSVLTFTVPKPIRTAVGVKLHIEDKADHYLPVSEYHLIPLDAAKSKTQTYWTEEVILLTKDGVGCVGE